MDANTIAREWLARTLETYPPQTARFLAEEKDRFRNPVGHTLAEALPVLVEEVLGEMDAARIRSALEELMRIRAVQDFTPSQAVGFVFLLKDLVGPSDRIDRLALEAFDLYMRCRERIWEMRARP